jgi:hypothetical protein
MNNIPQWQVNLLDRLPRPMAVVLIGFGAWFIDTGYLLLLIFLWFIGIPVLIGVLSQSWEWGVIALVAFAFGTSGVFIAGEAFANWYAAMNKKLPEREKKDDDSEPA